MYVYYTTPCGSPAAWVEQELTWDTWWRQTWSATRDGWDHRTSEWTAWESGNRCRTRPRCLCSTSRQYSPPAGARRGLRCKAPPQYPTPVAGQKFHLDNITKQNWERRDQIILLDCMIYCIFKRIIITVSNSSVSSILYYCYIFHSFCSWRVNKTR